MSRTKVVRGLAGAGILVAGVLAASGCGERPGRVTMDAGDGSPDGMLVDVIGRLLGEDREAWAAHLPAKDEIAAAARNAVSSGTASKESVDPVLADGGMACAARMKRQVADSLDRSGEHLMKCGVSRDKDMRCRALLWGRPWKSGGAQAEGRVYQPEIEIEAGSRHVFFVAERAAYGPRWRLLDVRPLGFVDADGKDATVHVCFTPLRRDARGLPEGASRRDLLGRQEASLQPEFVMEFKYRLRGEMPSAGRLIDMHRASIAELSDALIPLAKKIAHDGQPIQFYAKDSAFLHFSQAMPVASETIEQARKEGASEDKLREMECRNHLSLQWVAMRRH